MGTPNDLQSPAVAVSELGARADARTAEIQEARRIPEDLYRAAAGSGLFRQLVSPDLGGSGLTPLDWFRHGVLLAHHEASFGWVVTQGAAELGWIGAGGDTTWVTEMLQDPFATSASTLAGIGSLKVAGDRCQFGGRWAFNTGCQGASWIGGLALVEGTVADNGLPEIRWGWVPAERAEIIEDWDASGLRGTGSHSTAIAEQEIPTAWTFNPGSPTNNDVGPYRCVVGNCNWPISTSVAATQLGNARRALDEAGTIVATKAPAPDFVPLAQNAAVQRTIVEAEGLWQSAFAAVERELEAMWEEATTAEALSMARRVAVHTANTTANRIAVKVVRSACEVTGTAAVANGHVLSRCQRDAHALQGHISVNGTSVEQNAKVRLGLPVDPILV